MTGQTEIEKIKQAIASLEAQRSALGEAIIDLALAPLREKLLSLQSTAQGEQRRVVTVLFADLVDHTTMFSRLDPEDVRELLNTYFSAWKEILTDYGGVVEKFIGDAVMTVFGLQVTHENDPEQAIQAALSMRQRLEELNGSIRQDLSQPLAMRIGITTGEVVVSTLGERIGEQFVVVGEIVNMASRLQSAAPVGGILISHDTYRLVRGVFDVRPVDSIQIKGVDKPVSAYLVYQSKPRAFRMATRGVEGVETSMIGRDLELAQLQAMFRQTMEQRQCQVITIVGEAGIGKSRLIYEFDNWLELLPERIYYFKGRCYPVLRNLPYSLLRSLLAFRFEIQDSDPSHLVWKKLEGGITAIIKKSAGGSRKAYFIGRLLGFQLGSSSYENEINIDPRRFHELALSYLGEYFRTMAQQNPVVVLLEDIHAADDSSLDLVNHLEGSLAHQPILIVGTARPSLIERRPEWGSAFAYDHRLDLKPLAHKESQQLVREILQRVESLPEELSELVTQRAEGNPFFIEESVRMLLEEGVIQKTATGWQVIREHLNQIKIPSTLTGLLQSRLDSLELPQRLLLQRAAVIGRVFWDHAVEYIASEGQAEAIHTSISDLLIHLHNREIVFRRDRSTFEGTREYLFKHTLFRDVTYESLLKRQRRVYHARAAKWFVQISGLRQRTDEYAAVIALHYEQAGDLEKAASWYQRAGTQAAARFANSEAVHAFSQALNRTPVEDVPGRYSILLAREQILDRQGARELQGADLQSLAQLAERLNQPGVQAEVALRQANLAFTTGVYQQAIASAQQAVALARQAQDDKTTAESLYLWGRAIDFLSPSPKALEILNQALDLARIAGLSHLEADILMSLGPHYSDISEFDQARKYLTEALERYRQLGDRFGECKALGNLGTTWWGQANHIEARRYFEMTLDLAREIGDRRVEGIVVGNLGVIARELLNYSESQAYHLQALKINREIQGKHFECINLGNYAELALDLGDFEEAQSHYRQALGLAQELGVLVNQSAIKMGISQLMDYLEDYPAALSWAMEALLMAREAPSPYYESGCLFRTGRALLMLGRLEEAESYFQDCLKIQLKLELSNRALETLAGLARVRLAMGDLQSALHHVEEILSVLTPQTLQGTDEPARVYLTCCQVLQVNQDPRAQAILEEGYHFLQDLIAKVKNKTQRRSFLERVPCNRDLKAMWDQTQRSES